MTRNLFFTVLLLVFGCTVYAQGLGVNADGAAPHTSAMLDVKSPSKGVLIPRVALTGTDDVTTVPSPAASLLIYNSASAGSGATAVLPGFYFWSGTAWVRVTSQSDLSSSVWTLGGNAGTDTTKHFIGTTDNQPLVFRVNNTRAGLLSPFSASFSGGNTSWGYGALSANTTGFWNTASGQDALKSNTEGIINTASGMNSLYSNTTGNGNTASGTGALYSNTTGGSNTASGTSALYSNTTGSDNTASGASTLSRNTTGDGNTASGYHALYYNNTGKYNTASGYLALYYNTTGNYNTANGISALFSNSTGSNNTALGYFANVAAGGLTNATAIGYRAQVGSDNALVLGSIKGVNQAPSSVNVGIGTTTPDSTAALEVTSTARGVLIPRMTQAQREAIDGAATGLLVYQTDAPKGFYYNQGTAATPAWVALPGANSTWGLSGNAGTTDANFIGTTDNRPLVFKVNNTRAGWLDPIYHNTSWGSGALAANTTGYSNTASGFGALSSNTTGYDNTASGAGALLRNTTGYYNTASGASALFANTTGYDNTASGYNALSENTTGLLNTASGYSALVSNTTGSRNTASGGEALGFNTTGSYNTANGRAALINNTEGNRNTAIGYQALFENTTGSYNTALGSYADVLSGSTLTNATAIGAFAMVGSDNALVLGSIKNVNGAPSSVNVGIGTTTPDGSAALEVASTERGVLIPRMTAAQRMAIATPATGLLVYQTDAPIGFYFNQGTPATPSWVALAVVEPVAVAAKDPSVSASAELVKKVQDQQQQIDVLKRENEALQKLRLQVEQLSRAVRALSTPLQKQ